MKCVFALYKINIIYIKKGYFEIKLKSPVTELCEDIMVTLYTLWSNKFNINC